MTLNEREAFKAYLKTKGIVKIGWNCLGVITNVVREAGCTLGYNDLELMQEVWEAKAQAVPDTHIVVPRTREVVVAIEKMVEQQVEASGITSDVFRLDGWRILDAIQEASESGAEG